MKDLIPQDLIAQNPAIRSFEIGNTWFGADDSYHAMPYFRTGTNQRLENGLGQGKMGSLSILLSDSDNGDKLFLLHAQIHTRISYAWSIFELYVAPDVGAEAGLGFTDGGSGPMSEGFLLPILNLMVGWESGMRVNLYQSISLVGLAEQQYSLWYLGKVNYGLGLEYSPRSLMK